MKERLVKLIKEMEERKEYLDKRYDEANMYGHTESAEYYLGKWGEVNNYLQELEAILGYDSLENLYKDGE